MSGSSVVECNNEAASLEVLGSQVVKAECEETATAVKQEPLECFLCANRGLDNYDIYHTNTTSANITIHDFVKRFTKVDIVVTENNSKHVCKSCFDLINVLDEAEAEYNKLKEAFEAIISKNPLFEVKTKEVKCEVVFDAFEADDDSEDEPLALTRKRRQKPKSKVVKPKKKAPVVSNKKKTKIKSDSWQCSVCGTKGDGGIAAQSAHHLTAHMMPAENEVPVLPASPPVKMELEDEDDDDVFADFASDWDSSVDMSIKNVKIKKEDKKEPRPQRGRPRKKEINNKSEPKRERKRRPRTTYSCDQCNTTYTSLARLDEHKQVHGSKSPYICEICGARYKHKKACDIHVALHKGISDWKCEECNKLFPSKCALRRHNNIHTGKTNYQCDLCGKSFIHTSSFKMHKLSHSGVKAHTCGVCGLSLMTRSHLKRHARVHSGEKRHQCPLCGKRFSERYNLIAHSKSHAAPVAAVLVPAPRRRLFRCPYCPERYERKYMLENHVSATHGRTLERGPPTPRNTMSKLLKQQAQQASQAADTNGTSASDKTKVKSPAPDTPTPAPSKISDTHSNSSGAWYPAEFPTLRPDFSH